LYGGLIDLITLNHRIINRLVIVGSVANQRKGSLLKNQIVIKRIYPRYREARKTGLRFVFNVGEALPSPFAARTDFAAPYIDREVGRAGASLAVRGPPRRS
jgi:hypothetical protein